MKKAEEGPKIIKNEIAYVSHLDEILGKTIYIIQIYHIFIFSIPFSQCY
jgi:hypothetical protein